MIIKVGPKQDFDEEFNFDPFGTNNGFFRNREFSQAPRQENAKRPQTRDQSTRPSTKESSSSNYRGRPQASNPKFQPSSASKAAPKTPPFNVNKNRANGSTQPQGTNGGAPRFKVNRPQQATAA